MATSVVMPQMGYDMQEGTLVRWLKQEGEEIARGEAIAEIETDKAVIEMEAYASGVVLKAVVAEGSTVPVGDTIAFIGSPGEPVPDVAAPSAPVAEPAPEPEQAAETAEPAAAAAPGAVRASPVARRLAQEKGIDLAQVTGTGPNGRITRDDVVAHESAAAAAPAPAAEAPAPVEQAVRGQQGELVPLTRMRQAIARRTAQSKREVPHFYVSAGVDMTAAMALRQQINEALAGAARVSVNDLIVKACALTLAKYPAFNASFEGNNLRMNPAINVSIAVAVEYGLLVVSLGDCRGRSLVDISQAARRRGGEGAERGAARGRLHRRHVQHQQHGHVRRGQLLGDHLPATVGGHCRGHGAAAASGARRRDKDCADDAGDAVHRPPGCGRRAGCGVPGRGEADSGEPRKPGGVSPIGLHRTFAQSGPVRMPTTFCV